MTKEKKLQYLKEEEKRLEDAVAKYMAIDLNDAADIASHNLKLVRAEIKKLEA